jgi:uncharacterized protein YndB with AHSA1/START domain
VTTASRSRVIAASVQDLWDVISDPHHLPRWWPRVERVEDVHDGAFTEVMKTRKGKVVRADFQLLDTDVRERTLRWEQRVEGTPFQQVLLSSFTEVRLEGTSESDLALDAAGSSAGAPVASAGAPQGAWGGTNVTIELRQELRRQQTHGLMSGAPRLGSYLVRRAALSTLEQALDGLARISG